MKEEALDALRFQGERRLRAAADAIVAEALEAVDPSLLVQKALERDRPTPADDGRLIIAAVGKAALGMAEGAYRAYAGQVDEGIVLVPEGTSGEPPEGFALHRCGHPLPDRGSVDGARALQEILQSAGASDLVLLLLSGGGSACLALPADEVSLDDLRTLTGLLLRSGAPIQQVNAVRKHVERLKGGLLADAAAPAPLCALIISDVPGDALDVIASGPVTPDPTTFEDAVQVLERYGIWEAAPVAVRERLTRGRAGERSETPRPTDPCFDRVQTRIIGNVRFAVEAASKVAERRGYTVRVLSTEMTGEARLVGAQLAKKARSLRARGGSESPPVCLIAGGETTVTVTGRGRGGRNQEVALAAAIELEGVEDVLVASVGTDGVDGPTDAAGGRATGSTASRARLLGLDPTGHLNENDSYSLLDAVDDLIRTGPTGTNVMDLMLVLVGGPSNQETSIQTR